MNNTKPPVSPRPQSASPKSLLYPSLIDCEPPASIRPPATTSQGNKRSSKPSEKCPKQRIRSASAGRSPQNDLQARYWALLFENLQRAVDEIYQTCETDQSVEECKEAVLILENFAQEFRSLISWLRLSKDLEKTPPPNRPTSLAWEVRKSSPGKGFLKNVFLKYINLTSGKWTGISIGKTNTSISTGMQTETTEKSCMTEFSSFVSEEGMVSNCSESKLTLISNGNDNVNTTGKDFVDIIDASWTGTIVQPGECDNSIVQETKIVPVCEIVQNMDNIFLKSLSVTVVEPKEEIARNENLQTPCFQINPAAAQFDTSGFIKNEADCQSTKMEMKETNNVVEKLVDSISQVESSWKEPEDVPVLSDASAISTIMIQEITSIRTTATDVNIANKSSADVASPMFQPTLSSTSINSLVVTTPIITGTVSKMSPSFTNTSSRITGSTVLSSSGGSASKQNIMSKPSLSNSNVLNIHSHKTTYNWQNRSGSNAHYVSRVNSNRSNQSGKVLNEPRRIFQDRRGGYNSGQCRGGYRYTLTREQDKKPSLPQRNVPHGNNGSVSSSKLSKDQPKTGSTSSISSTSSGQSWADKVKGLSTVDKGVINNKLKTEEDDNEGWETVHRGRTRSRASPMKTVQPHPLSNSLTNLKENDSEKKPPILRRVHTEVNTFSARGIVKSNLEIAKKVNQSKPAPVSKPMPNRLSKKDVVLPIKLNTVTSKSRLQTTPKSVNQIRDCKVSGAKRLEVTKKKCVENKKIVESKLSVDSLSVDASNVKNENASSIVDLKVEGNLKTKKTINDNRLVIELGDRTKEVMSESKMFSNDVEKEEHGSCDIFSEEEIELSLEGKESLYSCNRCEDEDDDGVGQKILEEDEEDGRESGTPSSDQLDEVMNTFEDSTVEWDEYKRQKIEQIHQMGLTWGEQMDQLDLEFRTPGRAPQMHEKLSSPFRKRSVTETLRRHEEKLAKAQEQRERLLEEKAQRFKDIAKKAEEMKQWKEEQQEQIRLSMHIKLQKAEEKRRMQLQKIIRKAHDEEEKVNEIAFINTLEAQNKRHDILSKEKDHELRLTEIQEERQRKLEEKAAKEAAAEERRKVLETERQNKLQEMQEKRKLRDQKIEQQFQEKEKERVELANQKARDREQRLSALSAAQQANMEELQKKIQQKQEDSARRHEENIEQIRQKAFELSIRRYSSNNDEAPRLVPYETKKLCSLCNVLIVSEVYLLSHLRGKKHQEAVKDQHQGMEPSTEALELYNIKHIIDAPADQIDPNIALDKERQKALKKRCKKIKQRLVTKGQEWEKLNAEKVPTTNSLFKQKFQKSIRDLQRHLSALSSCSWESNIVTSLERLLGESERCLEKGQCQDKLTFHQLGGTTALLQMLQQLLLRDVPDKTLQVVPDKTLVRAAVVYRLACWNCTENCLNTLLSNKVIILLDLLMHRLKDLVPDNQNRLRSSSGCSSVPVDPVAGGLMTILATIILLPQNASIDVNVRVHDVVGYTVSLGIVDKLSHYLSEVQGPLDTETEVVDFILQSVSFLHALPTMLQANRYDSVFESRKDDDTQLLATLQVTQLASTVSVLYGMLLHGGAPSRGGSAPPPPMAPTSNALALATLRMLNRVALLDYQMLQSVLGSEGLSLQLRHIASYLLWFCSHWDNPLLLNEVILLVGYFALLHSDNQLVLQSGQCPSVLQQLCSLPFQYFSDPQLTDVLFPTLVACCYESPSNRLVIEQEMSPELLSNYIEGSLLDIHQDNLSARTDKKGEEDLRLALSTRFPKDKWTSAKHFFQERSAHA